MNIYDCKPIGQLNYMVDNCPGWQPSFNIVFYIHIYILLLQRSDKCRNSDFFPTMVRCLSLVPFPKPIAMLETSQFSTRWQLSDFLLQQTLSDHRTLWIKLQYSFTQTRNIGRYYCSSLNKTEICHWQGWIKQIIVATSSQCGQSLIILRERLHGSEAWNLTPETKTIKDLFYIFHDAIKSAK